MSIGLNLDLLCLFLSFSAVFFCNNNYLTGSVPEEVCERAEEYIFRAVSALTSPTTPVPSTPPTSPPIPAPSTSTPPTLVPSTAPTTYANAAAIAKFKDTVCTILPTSCSDLSIPGTPQHDALKWLGTNPHLLSYSDKKKTQRYALATLALSTTMREGRGYEINNSKEECLWSEVEGAIECTSDGVSWIVLHNLSGGTVPRELALLNDSLGELFA